MTSYYSGTNSYVYNYDVSWDWESGYLEDYLNITIDDLDIHLGVFSSGSV